MAGEDYKYTSFRGCLVDPFARSELQQEQLVDLVAHKSSVLKDKKPVGRIIKAELRDDGFLTALIRIKMIHDHCLPEGCQYADGKQVILQNSLI